MKKLSIWIILGASLTGCLGHEPTLSIDPEFSSYVTRFESLSVEFGVNRQIDDLVIRFGTMSNPLHRGYCNYNNGGTPEIVINEEIWEFLDANEREALLLHEMGHCVLYRRHKDDRDVNGIPDSIMHTYALPSLLYECRETRYKEELFLPDVDFSSESSDYADCYPVNADEDEDSITLASTE